MRYTSQRFSGRFRFASGILLAATFVQVALADVDERATSQAAAHSVAAAKPKAEAAPLTGPQVYNNVCVACHSPPGIGGAPALGDGDAWAARLVNGVDILIDHALNGYSGSTGIMPKKGGRTDLSDAEIIAAVEYMVEKASP